MPGLYQEGKVKVLSLGDLHHPFELENLLDLLIPYKNKVDVLLFGGDDQDCQSVSKFRKKYRIPFVDEMIGTRQMFIDIINLLKPRKVVWIKGNHNERLISYLSDNLNEDILEIMPETNLELIIDEGFNKKDRLHKTKTFYEPLRTVFPDIEIVFDGQWYTQLGDTIYCHPSAYKKAMLKTSEDAWLWFKQNNFIFNNMVVFHTHAQGMFKYGDGWLIEAGCTCKPQEYATGGARFMRPQANGFLYGIFDEDKFIYDESKLVSL